MTKYATTIISLILATIMILGATTMKARAYDLGDLLGDLGISTSNPLSTDSIIQGAGLDSAAFRACTGDIFDILKGRVKDRLTAWLNNALQDLLAQIHGNLITRAVCLLNNIEGKATVVGNRKGTGEECSTISQSVVGQILQQQAQDRLESNFLASCIAAFSRQAITETVDAMIQEQGPGGAGAWAQVWSQSAYIEPDMLGKRRFWAMLVNTDICEYMRDDVLNSFDVPNAYRDNPPDISAIDLRVDSDDPFPVRAACTLPVGYDPRSDMSVGDFLTVGGWDFIQTLREPQNNYDDFLQMGSEELARQRAAMTQSANNQLVAGGGFLPAYRDCVRAPDGNGCISYGIIKQPPGGVRDIQSADINAQYAAINASSGEGKGLLSDVASALRLRILDLASRPLPLKLELGPETDQETYTTSTPTPSASPGDGSANDPLCTGGDPRCTCVTNDLSAQALATNTIAPAISAALQAHPELFVAGTNQIAPGVNQRLVLQAICDQLPTGLCIPHPRSDDQIVFIGSGISIAFDVITGSGFVRINGGRPIAACEAGVQD